MTDKFINQRKAICKQIADKAKEQGLTQTAIAKRTGIEQGNISRIYNGRYAVSLDTLLNLCKAVNCEITVGGLRKGKLGGE